MLTLTEYRRLRLGALACADFPTFVAGEGGSLPGYYCEDDHSHLLMSTLYSVWRLREAGIREIRDFLALTCRDFCETYGVSLRTVSAWESDSPTARNALSYVVDLIGMDAVNAAERRVAEIDCDAIELTLRICAKHDGLPLYRECLHELADASGYRDLSLAIPRFASLSSAERRALITEAAARIGYDYTAYLADHADK